MASQGSIGRVLASWAALAVRVPAATIAAFAVAAAGALYFAASTLGVNTDTTDLIDASLPWRQDFIDFRATFPARDRNLAIVVDADSAGEADAFAARLLGELEARPELYRSVLLPGAGEFFEREGLLYIGVPELEALSDRLAAAQPLIGMLGDSVDGARVVALATRAAGAADGSAQAQDFASFDAELGATLAAAERGERRPLDWRALVGMGDPNAVRRIVVLQPKLEFGRLQPASEAIANIRAIVTELSAGDASPPTVRLTGSVAMEHEELLTVSRGASLAGLLTVVLVGLGLYAVFGSWRLLAVSLVTLLVGLAFTAAFAAAAVGHLNLLSVAFVVLNVGLGSDYVIHVSLRYKELRARGTPAREAVLETMRGVGASLVMCAATTAAGFYAFLPTAFEGVSELGLIAGTGVLLSMLTSVTLLPALLVAFASAERVGAARSWLKSRPLAAASARPRVALGVTLLVAVAAFLTLPAVSFDNNPINLRDPRTESVVTLRDLAATGEAPLFALTALAPDRGTAERWARELAALPEVRTATTAAALVPSAQDEKIAILEDTALLMGGDLGTVAQAPQDPAALEDALRALAATETQAVARARAAAQRLLERLGSAAPADRERALRALDADLAAGLPRELERLATGLTAQPFDRDALPEALRERWIAADGRELVEISPADDVSENAAADRFIAAVRSVVPTATGLPVVYKEASATVVGAFQQALGLASLMVVVIVWLSLRSFRDTLLVVVPILLAAAITGAATVWLDMPFNYANIIALPLLVGIGVDNGIHVVHRLRSESAATLFQTSTMNAVLASGLTTIASFGTLAFSAHVGTASMGKLLGIGLVATMATSLVVLPAWLAFRAQRHAARGERA